MTRTSLLLALGLVPILATSACNAADPAANGAQAVAPAASAATDQRPFTATEVSRFDQPWAMTFLPDGSLLVTEKRGKLQHLDLASGQKHEITGVPKVAYGGQGALATSSCTPISPGIMLFTSAMPRKARWTPAVPPWPVRR